MSIHLNPNRKDFLIVVNSIDLENDRFSFKEYVIEGNGVRYPECNTVDINELLKKIRTYEIEANRIPIDVVTCVIPDNDNGKVYWDTPGIEGDLKDVQELGITLV